MKPTKWIAVLGACLSLAAAVPFTAAAKHGADDPAGHVRHGGGADDGAGHR